MFFSLASIFGKLLHVDAKIKNFTRPSIARILVKLDVITMFHKEVRIRSHSLGY